jgi:hypothetical protein
MASVVTGKLHRLSGLINRHIGDARIRRLALQISGASRGLAGDDLATLGELYWWVKKNIQYVPDPPRQDIFVSPVTVLNTRQDDCDGFSVLIGTLGKALGFNVKLRAVGKERGRFDHVYPLLDVPRGTRSRWVALDALPGRALGQEPVGFFYEDKNI